MKNRCDSFAGSFLIGLSFAALSLTGCSLWSIDDDVSPTPQVAWNPPAKSLPKKQLTAGTNYTGQPLDLASLMDIAYTNSPVTRQSWQQARYAAASYGISEASWLPSGGLAFQLGKSKDQYFFNNTITNQQLNIATGSLSLTWLLLDFGARFSGMRAAEQALFASNFAYNQALQDLALSVQSAYFNLNAAQASVFALKCNLEDAKYSLEAADKKLRSGLGNLQDTLLAKADYLDVTYKLEQAKADVESARANLATTIGLPISAQIQIVPPSSPPDTKLLETQVSELMAQSLKARPALLSAYGNLRSSQESVKEAQSVFFPQLYFGANLTQARLLSSSNSKFNTGDFGLQAQWNIFDVFTDRFQLLQTMATAKAQESALKQVELQVMADVWTYYYAFVSAIEQLGSVKALVEASLAAFEATKLSYTSGRDDLLSLLRAQDSLANARLQDIQAHAKAAIALANLTHAIGYMDVVAPAPAETHPSLEAVFPSVAKIIGLQEPAQPLSDQ